MAGHFFLSNLDRIHAFCLLLWRSRQAWPACYAGRHMDRCSYVASLSLLQLFPKEILHDGPVSIDNIHYCISSRFRAVPSVRPDIVRPTFPDMRFLFSIDQIEKRLALLEGANVDLILD